MSDIRLGEIFWKELATEAPATRKCLGGFPEGLFDWKPHEKSMSLGHLTLIVAEIPLWIQTMIEVGEIDFATFKHEQPKTAEDFVKYFDDNMNLSKKALQDVSNEVLNELFHLKNNGQVIMSISKGDSVSSTINHLVHHRGQLTVYLRLNNISVPSIYGPSADDKGF